MCPAGHLWLDELASVDVADGTLRDKLTVRPMAASWGGEEDLEVIAAERIEAGEAAPYSGILGKANELATATKLSPKDQMAFWRFLISVDDDIVCCCRSWTRRANPVCFINDAFGPARSSPDDEIWPNVRFQASRRRSLCRRVAEDREGRDALD